jgi:hypothetical protein
MQTTNTKQSSSSKSRLRSKHISIKTIGFFLLFLLVAFLPLSTFISFIKQSGAGTYLPSRFFISECLHANSFPWWNPYINFGMPQFADWNSGFWSPITWIIGGLMHYNAFTYIAEHLFYILLSGIGMFQLCRNFKYGKTVSYISGFAYMSSGFMLSHLSELNWLGGAAFLPWCIWGYQQLINRYNLKNIMLSAVLFYLFFAAAGPGFAIGGIYFFLGYIIHCYYIKKAEKQDTFSRVSFLKKNVFMLFFLLLFSIGMIVGLATSYPLIDFSQQAGNTTSIENAFPLQGLISALSPAATAKGDAFFMSDIKMRNIYIGMALMLFLIPALITGRKTPQQRFFLFAMSFFLVFSLGGYTTFLSGLLFPMKSVTQPGMLLLFVVFSGIMIAAESMQQFMKEKKKKSSELEKTFLFMQLFYVGCIIIGIIGVILSKHGLIKDLHLISSAGGLNAKLKVAIDSINIFELLIVQGIIQSILINYITRYIYKQTYKRLILISATELAVAALLQIPFTGVGSITTTEADLSLQKTPAKIPTPLMTPISQIQANDAETGFKGIGDWNLYSKRVGVNYHTDFPYTLKLAAAAFKNNHSICSNKPYVFNTQQQYPTSNFEIRYFKNNMIDLSLKTTTPDTLVYQQIALKNWKCVLNGEKVKPITYKGAFLAVALKSNGKNDVKFVYQPGMVETAFKISMYAFLVCLLYIVIVNFRRAALS